MSHNGMSQQAREQYRVYLAAQTEEPKSRLQIAEEWAEKARGYLADVQYLGWRIELVMDDYRPYLQIQCDNDICSLTGDPYSWHGRKWLLSPHMCKSEVIRTAYLAVQGAVMHEFQENFQYKGLPFMDPHIDVDQLAELRARGDAALDTREKNNE